jgi:hypothetical protein
MKVVSGMSSQKVARDAVKEAVSTWKRDEKPSMILVFHSSTQNAQEIASELHDDRRASRWQAL